MYDKLLFTDDDVFGSMDDIDPSIIVPHDWKKLQRIWKGVNADYKAAINRFSLSGTHSSEFYSFCNGKQEVYYLQKHLDVKPELAGTVKADLPKEAFKDTAVPPKTSSTSSSSSKQKHVGQTSEVAETIQEMNDSKMQSEIAKRKLDLLENAEKQHKKEEERKVKEEERKEDKNKIKDRKSLRMRNSV